MPDVAIVGGGIIGAACAHELACRGLSVTLIERDELAAGASGRNQGWFVLSADPPCAPMSRRSLATYLEIVDSSPVPVRFDREPIGHLLVALDEDGAALAREKAADWAAMGVATERLDGRALRNIVPGLSPHLAECLQLDYGRRLAPRPRNVVLA